MKSITVIKSELRYSANCYGTETAQEGDTINVPDWLADSLILGGDACAVGDTVPTDAPNERNSFDVEGFDLTDLIHIGKKSAKVLEDSDVSLADIAEDAEDVNSILMQLWGMNEEKVTELVAQAQSYFDEEV